MEDQFISDYLERLEYLQRHIHQAVDSLPAEALDWVPGQDMNSVAVLLAHTAGSLRFWIGDVAVGDPSDRVREREFQTRGQTKTSLLKHLDEVMAYARGALPRLSLDNLEEERNPGPGEKPRTRGWALLHALEHATLHLGHIELTSQLWGQKARH